LIKTVTTGTYPADVDVEQVIEVDVVAVTAQFTLPILTATWPGLEPTFVTPMVNVADVVVESNTVLGDMEVTLYDTVPLIMLNCTVVGA
jgi:hypothetical protein